MFRHFDWKYGNKVSANIYYSEALSHKIYAASDSFLMPSLFEPCGLSQLMSLRYGTIPIVRETGGLKDTVEPFNEYENTVRGFSFREYSSNDLLKVFEYAYIQYYDYQDRWNMLIDNAMNYDVSFASSAKEYEDLYRRVLE